MPIKIDLHDNTSQVRARVVGDSSIPMSTGDSIDYRKLEIALSKEIEDRILGDANLQEQINILIKKSGARYLAIDENNNGSISISILDVDENILDTKTITLTEKIIKSANVDYDNNKINYICNDDSVIELDISEIVDHIAEAVSEVEEIKAAIEEVQDTVEDIQGDITEVKGQLSIMDNKINSIQGTLATHSAQISILQNTTAAHTEALNIINTQTIPAINNQLTTLNTVIEAHGSRLTILETDMGKVTLSIASLEKNKIDKDFTSAEYTHIDPSSLTVDKLDELLVYISKNGVPNYAKLNELGFVRVRDYNDASGMAEVDLGDLLIDME